jgi:hypothetical protein
MTPKQMGKLFHITGRSSARTRSANPGSDTPCQRNVVLPG